MRTQVCAKLKPAEEVATYELLDILLHAGAPYVVGNRIFISMLLLYAFALTGMF